VKKEKYTYGYSPAEYKTFRQFAWKMLLSFGLTYMFFYNGRQNINLVLTQMAAELGSTTAAIGVVSSALFWSYAFGQLINGRLGQIIGHKRIITIGVIGSAIMNILISLQTSIPAIAVLWGINGYFQSMVWSNGIGVLNHWWPKAERGFATGFVTFFAGFAQVVTYLSVLVCLEINPEWGWAAAFRLPILPMLLFLIGFLFLFKEKPEDVGLASFKEPNGEEVVPTESVEKENFLKPYLEAIINPRLILACLIAVIAGVGRYGLITWIPTYFTETMGLSIKDSIVSAILLPLGHALAMFVFPWISDKLFRGRREPVIFWASALAFVGMIAFAFVKSQLLASILLLFVGIFSQLTGLLWAIGGDIGGKKNASLIVGFLDWAVYMGAAFQAIGFGTIKDRFGWPAIFIFIGILYVLILVLTVICSKIQKNEMNNGRNKK